ncbi:MAG: hypothetical protein J5I98_24665 [Phaeodactylibacter sp.]|nr:hypothetical protein [Phaeodactylibacter sp.]
MATELDGLQHQAETLVRKINFFREELARAYDAEKKFGLGEDIREAEEQLAAARRRMKELTGLDTTSGESLLDDQIRNLEINKEIGAVYLVNCDREPNVDQFWAAFDTYLEGETPYQFYFVLACPTQQPHRFSERMTYELVIQELEEEYGAIHYVREPDSQRVRIEDLPLGRNLKVAQREFRKYFGQRFQLGETSFEEYLKTGLPRLEYQYVATIFYVNDSQWKQELMQEYLQWLVDSFRQSATHEDVPTFLFFFAVYLDHAHVEPASEFVRQFEADISGIVKANPDCSTLINRLRPVPAHLLADWIRGLGEQNQTRIDDVIKALASGLPANKKEQFKKDQLLDMADIELFQRRVYEIVNK